MSQNEINKKKKLVVVQTEKRKRKQNNIEDSFDRRYATAVKSYQNYMEGLNLILKEKERNILKTLRKRSSPFWFQELTDEQCELCDQLLVAIGDDMEERTIFRTTEVLRKLGIYPMCPNRILRTALILCNRNDISLLWILLELHYIRHPGKASHDADYSINERLLLSSIAHLDMITTLRGLDQVLPPRKVPSLVSKVIKGNCQAPLQRLPCATPYTNRLILKTTQTRYTVPITVQPHRNEFLGRYFRYRDPEYIVRNEESRWFAKCSGSGRNLFSCKGHFSSSEKVTESETMAESIQSADVVVNTLLDEHIRNLIAQVECCRMLCPKHHQQDQGSASLLQSLQRISPAREALMEAVRSQCAKWKEEELQSDGKRQVESLLKRLVDEAVAVAILEPMSSCPECWQRFDMQQKLRKDDKCTCAPSEDSNKDQVQPIGEPTQRYFKYCGNGAISFEFDYDQIHDDNKQRMELQLCPIKNAIQRALGVEPGASKIGFDHAIEVYAKKTWHDELKRQQELEANEKNQKKQSLPETTDILDMDHIDTKDVSFLRTLLKRALRKLAERPKYILATFPDVHKLPILIAWIRHRYGVPIDPQERAAAMQESKIFWDTLIPRATAIRWPTRKDTGLEHTVNWDYKPKLEAVAGKMMYTFHRRFKNVQVQESRLWWASMAAYHAGADRFRRTFSAYFPNCEPKIIGPGGRPNTTKRPMVTGTNSKTSF